MSDRDFFAPYQDLEALIVPHPTSRLEVIGFIFTDPFDIFLRKLSTEYLEKAWFQLISRLEKYKVKITDLSWGWAHPGETQIGYYPEKRLLDEPHYFIGWTSQKLAQYSQDNKYNLLDMDLNELEPQLRFFATWRSSKWKIPPNDFKLGLKLIEYLCIRDLTDWSPDIVLAENRQSNDLWLKIAKAYARGDQAQLDLACEEAKAVYSPTGYRIVILALTLLNIYKVDKPKLQIASYEIKTDS